jgi:hypothetical protein
LVARFQPASAFASFMVRRLRPMRSPAARGVRTHGTAESLR